MEKRNALLGVVRNRQGGVKTLTNPTTNTNQHSFILVSNDNGGMRYDWMSGETYIEQLSVSGASFEKLNTFFKDHNRNVDSAVGRIDNVRIEDEQLVGDVIFGTGEDEQSICRKYSEGILTDVSIGYAINKYEVEERDGEADIVTVTDFEVFELSAVGIGFDANAKKRNEDIDNEEIEARVRQLELDFNITQNKREF